jgi:hypothetical protein
MLSKFQVELHAPLFPPIFKRLMFYSHINIYSNLEQK